jgi:hypothetical protein
MKAITKEALHGAYIVHGNDKKSLCKSILVIAQFTKRFYPMDYIQVYELLKNENKLR